MTGKEKVYKKKGDTWPKILKYNYEKYGHNRRAMRYKHFGVWQPYTWNDYYVSVKNLALGLLSLGLEPGDKVLIIGDNAPEWYYAELAAQALHGASVGLYSGLLPTEIKYIAENSEARFAVVQDQEQVDKLLQIKDALPLLKKVIYWNYKGLTHYDDPILERYDQVLHLGERVEGEHPGIFEQLVETGRPDDVCALVYTSGTTGPVPKGAVHTYRTMGASAEYHLLLDPWYENDNVLPYLPPAWMAEQWFLIGCHLLSGCILNFAEAPETQQRDTRETGPSIVFYGARLWENQAAMVQARILSADAFKRLAFRVFMPIGYRMVDLRVQKKNPSLCFKMIHAAAEIILLRRIKNSLGLSNARICYTTGAMLSPDAFKFYRALDVRLKNLYGSTEGGALACARNDDISLETLGPPHEGAEVGLTDEGELIHRGPGVFLGYYRNPAETDKVLKDGWFHSGDSASIREDGHLVFIDRVRSLFALKSGDILAPQHTESRLRFSPHIQDAWVLAGPKGDYVSAIIVIDYSAVGRWAGQKGVAYNNFSELSQAPEVYELVRQDVDRVNHFLPTGLKVRKYVNLHKAFDPDEGELTKTGKLRRRFLEERYRDLIDAIYSDRNEVPIEFQTGFRQGQTIPVRTRVKINSVGGET